MKGIRKIKNMLCCSPNKHILLEDDDDDVASILEQHIRNSSYNNNRNNDSNNIYDNNIDTNNNTNTHGNDNNRKGSFHNQQEISEKSYDYDNNSTRLQQQQIIVKSVLRKRRNASVSTIKSDHNPRRRHNVLLFGDSLTAGWVKNSEGYSSYHPYGLRLQKKFEEEGLDIEVTVSGVPGECVTQTMEERLKNELEQPGKWYDWVVILGGTNDVINGYSAWEIFDSLKRLYTLCSRHGARVLGITIPEFDWDIVNHLDYQRRIVNEHLNVYNDLTTRNAFTLFLLDRFFPMHSLTAEQRKIFWDHDGVHPTQEGYDLMGDMVFDILFKEGTWD